LLIYNYIQEVWMSGSQKENFGERVEHAKLSKKTLNHFAEFAIVNELLIIENRRISARGRIRPPQPDAGSTGRRRAVARDTRSCLQ